MGNHKLLMGIGQLLIAAAEGDLGDDEPPQTLISDKRVRMGDLPPMGPLPENTPYRGTLLGRAFGRG